MVVGQGSKAKDGTTVVPTPTEAFGLQYVDVAIEPQHEPTEGIDGCRITLDPSKGFFLVRYRSDYQLGDAVTLLCGMVSSAPFAVSIDQMRASGPVGAVCRRGGLINCDWILKYGHLFLKTHR
jgi:hypothetical protein